MRKITKGTTRTQNIHCPNDSRYLRISHTICMPKILMENNSKLTVEGQRRLNPILKKVVSVEVLKLLDIVVIYPISDS